MKKTPNAILVALLIGASLPVMVACSPTPTRETAGEFIDDATITSRVKLALADDPQVKARQVSVETFRGVVQLSGFVDSAADAKRAGELARNVPGVRSVKNDIRTKPGS